MSWYPSTQPDPYAIIPKVKNAIKIVNMKDEEIEMYKPKDLLQVHLNHPLN